MIRFVASLSAALAAFSFALAADGRGQPLYVPVFGDHEFTGRMIARPVQVDVWMNNGLNVWQAVQRRTQADASVRPLFLQYRPQVDDYIIFVPKGSDENSLSRALMATGNFEYVEPDWRVYLCDTTPNDTLYSQMWHLPKIGAPQAWDLFTGNNSITVALTDTGVRLDHEDLAASLVPGYNAVNQLPQANGGQVNDLNGHGTHTAGTAGAIGNNAKGVVGIGWNFKVMPIRVSNQAGGSSSISILTNGALWGIDHGARVVSTSYSGADAAAVQTTGAYIKSHNGIYCWAAGNANQNLSFYDHVDVTIVGATDSNDAKASFSNYGLATDVYAPGVNILSSYFNAINGYAFMDGTSMACPCTAGVCAMILAANPSLTGAQAETILYRTCTDLGPAGNDTQWGWGRVQLRNALNDVYTNFWFVPTSLVVRHMALISGGVPELANNDNNRLVCKWTLGFEANPQPGEIEVETVTTNRSIGTLDVAIEGFVNRPMIWRTDMYDFVANLWVTVDVRNALFVEGTYTVTPPVPNRFRQAGTGRILVKLITTPDPTASRGAAFAVNVDRINVRTAP